MQAMPMENTETLETITSDIDTAERLDDKAAPDNDEARLARVESDIRDFVRNDIAYLRRPAGAGKSNEGSGDSTVANVNFLIQRVAGASLAEIDALIEELERLREVLHAEGQRVQRELTSYAQLSQSAMKSTRMIADNMAQWKHALPSARPVPSTYDRH